MLFEVVSFCVKLNVAVKERQNDRHLYSLNMNTVDGCRSKTEHIKVKLKILERNLLCVVKLTVFVYQRVDSRNVSPNRSRCIFIYVSI